MGARVHMTTTSAMYGFILGVAYLTQLVNCEQHLGNNKQYKGDHMLVTGQNNVINGNSVTAVGNNLQINGNLADVTGNNVRLWGNSATLRGDNAYVQGEGVFKVTGNNANVHGTEVNVDGNNARIIARKANVHGNNAVTEGGVAIITGENARVTGPDAVVIGNNAHVTGDNAQVTGYNPTVFGNRAFICTDFGREVKVTGSNINMIVNFKYLDRQVNGVNSYDNKVEVYGAEASIVSAWENCSGFVREGLYDYSVTISGRYLVVKVKGQVVTGESYNADGNNITINRN